MFSGSCTEDVLLPSRSLSTGEAAAPETFFWLPPGRQQWPGSQNIGKELIVIFLVLGEFFCCSQRFCLLTSWGAVSVLPVRVSSLGATCCAALCKEPNTLCLNKAKQQVGALQVKKKEAFNIQYFQLAVRASCFGLLQPPGVCGSRGAGGWSSPGKEAAAGREQPMQQLHSCCFPKDHSRPG